jgi:FMN-dependent NADH-azoreductase
LVKGRRVQESSSNKKAVLIYASAGEYGQGNLSDFQKPYLRRWLNFIGIIDIHEISIAPTLADPEALALTKCKAKAAAVKFAATF